MNTSFTYVWSLTVNDVGFVISEEEDLASGSGTRPNHSELLCDSFITVEKDRENFWHRHQKGVESAPLIALAIGYYSKSKECLRS